jgi:hypothetical protein
MGDFQPWDVLQHWLTPEEYRGYQKGVAIAYLARERQKGGNQDIRKAAHHLQRLVEELGHLEATATVAINPPHGHKICCGQPNHCADVGCQLRQAEKHKPGSIVELAPGEELPRGVK